MRILLIDDDELVRAVLVETISDAGHDVIEAADPIAAFALPAAAGPPSVVITDINLGAVLNGLDAAAVAHRKWPDIRVMLIREPDPRDRYLQKPSSGHRLLRAIKELVQRT
jgi:DNA-binding NarL/FixJ family response regulator